MAAPAAPRRPNAVSMVMIAIVALIALCLLETAVGVYILGAEAHNGSVDGDGFTERQAVVIDIVLNLLIAAGFGPSLVLILRGRRQGQVLALVLSILYLLARCGCGAVSGLVSGLYASGNPDFDRDTFTFNPNIMFVVLAIELMAIVVTIVTMSLLYSLAARQYFHARR